MSHFTDPVWALHHLIEECGLPPDSHSLGELLKANGIVVLLAERDRGDGRTAHYGDGKQPWDDCLEEGWAHPGAAFSILRYLRRSKMPERDLQAAKVYFGWLKELAKKDKEGTALVGTMIGGSLHVFRRLVRCKLTAVERERLGVTAEDLVY